MGIFNKERNEVLKMTQENLIAMQENNKIIYSFLENFSLNTTIEKTMEISEEKKKTVAYALNLCTVSVSQIVDYDDFRFLEYEYEAILNNLNLEYMPKDEELLKILKQLLDVITYFRIQEEDKKILEKEYQYKMKNAIWSAIPNMSFVVAGNPVSVALSLASQVGIGYMNYRKAKSEIISENEKRRWALQKSAMEQFHGLKKELFDTAWRLADKYEFKDEYRLTERQITQFNQILLDNDSLRKCERLEYISNRFQAYPPFYYYFANAANSVYMNDVYELEIRHKYKWKAIENYKKYLALTGYNLLREDQLEASASLELFELLKDKEKDIKLLERAIKASNNASDVVEICAISYLSLGYTKEAKELLRYLVNEGYNHELNTKLLSRLYVMGYLDGNTNELVEYKEIKRRSPNILLFPLPEENNIDNREELEQEFIRFEKFNLREQISEAFIQYISYCEKRYNDILKRDSDVTEDIAVFLNDIIETISLFGEYEASVFKESLFDSLDKLSDELTQMMKIPTNKSTRSPLIPYKDIFEKPYNDLADLICSKINIIENQLQVSELEDAIYKFKEKNNLIENNSNYETGYDIQNKINFSFIDKRQYDLEKRMMSIIKKDKYRKECLLKANATKIEYCIKGEHEFNCYIQRHSEVTCNGEVLAIINDKSHKDIDLLITSSGIRYVESNLLHTKKKNDWLEVEFSKISLGKKENQLILDEKKYEEDRINIDVLMKLIHELAKVNDAQGGSDWYLKLEGKIVYLK